MSPPSQLRVCSDDDIGPSRPSMPDQWVNPDLLHEPERRPPPQDLEEFRRLLRTIREEVEAIFAQQAEAPPPDAPPPPPD